MPAALKLFVVLAFAVVTSACSSHMYYSEAKVYVDAVEQELVRLGACTNRQSCASNRMVMWESGGWEVGPFRGGGVSLAIYRVADVAIANALIERCQKMHMQAPDVPVSIVIHSNAHIDTLHPGTPVIVKQARLS